MAVRHEVLNILSCQIDKAFFARHAGVHDHPVNRVIVRTINGPPFDGGTQRWLICEPEAETIIAERVLARFRNASLIEIQNDRGLRVNHDFPPFVRGTDP